MDLVTETDKQCEEEIYSRLRAAFPDHAFIGEEGSASQGFTAELTDAPTWLVDPVDGESAISFGYVRWGRAHSTTNPWSMSGHHALLLACGLAHSLLCM